MRNEQEKQISLRGRPVSLGARPTFEDPSEDLRSEDIVAADDASQDLSRVPMAAASRGIPAFLRERPMLVRVLSVSAFLLLWECIGRRANPIFMTYPTAVTMAAAELLRSGELAQAFAQSMLSFGLGLAIAVLAGIVVGLLMGQFWWAEYALDPLVNALYATPRVALVPLVMLWFGLELLGKLVIIVLIAIFPVIINTYSGVKDVRGSLLEIGEAFAATQWQLFSKVILPAALPFIMAGIRLAVGLAIIGMIVAEFFTAINGLGGLIITYSNTFATAKVFVPVAVVASLGVCLSHAVLFIERRTAPWRQAERRDRTGSI